jgi:hypothetical protein
MPRLGTVGYQRLQDIWKTAYSMLLFLDGLPSCHDSRRHDVNRVAVVKDEPNDVLPGRDLDRSCEIKSRRLKL